MKKKYFIRALFLLVLIIIFIAACKEKDTEILQDDTPTKGIINVSIDESFEPVMREQIAMYETSFPGTKINATYKTEADCLKDFFTDSLTRMIIVTRGLTANEEAVMTKRLLYNPGWNELASDAIALVVNKKSIDTLSRWRQSSNCLFIISTKWL